MKKYSLKPGKKYIRIAPFNGDYSYTDEPIVFVTKSSSGKILYKNDPDFSSEYGLKELDRSWDDGNWIPFDAITKMPKVPLNSRKGELLGLKLSSGLLHGPFKLICATKYHVILEYIPEETKPFVWIYNADYTDEDKWDSWLPI